MLKRDKVASIVSSLIHSIFDNIKLLKLKRSSQNVPFFCRHQQIWSIFRPSMSLLSLLVLFLYDSPANQHTHHHSLQDRASLVYSPNSLASCSWTLSHAPLSLDADVQ